MSISQLFKTVNNALREEDFIKASVVKTNEDVEHYRSMTKKGIVRYDEIVRVCQKLNINPEHIYFTEEGKSMDSYHYYCFPILIDIFSFDEDSMGFLQIKKRIESQKTYFQKALEEKDYAKIISLVDSKIQFITLEKLFEKIPDEEKYPWFAEVYTLQEYGFHSLPKKLVNEAFSKQTSAYREKMFESLNQIHPGDELTLYRGVGTHSTNPNEAYSWSLSFNVAVFFSSRFDDMNGEIYTAKVKKSEIVDYLTGRKEEEIIVKPGTVYDIQAFGMVNTKEELDRLDEYYLLSEFHKFLEDFDKDLFLEPDGVHGYLHMKRVLLHTISLANELELDDYERNILCLAALYHDIGRINDDEDDTHGAKSWEKMRNENIIEHLENDYELYDDELRVLQFIIENHCLNDEIVWKNLESFDTRGYSKQETRKLMEIFKDADGLDRVRLGDLDAKYLRTHEAKQRILFAKHVLKGIR